MAIHENIRGFFTGIDLYHEVWPRSLRIRPHVPPIAIRAKSSDWLFVGSHIGKTSDQVVVPPLCEFLAQDAWIQSILLANMASQTAQRFGPHRPRVRRQSRRLCTAFVFARTQILVQGAFTHYAQRVLNLFVGAAAVGASFSAAAIAATGL